jgi:hypothetical protein
MVAPTVSAVENYGSRVFSPFLSLNSYDIISNCKACGRRSPVFSRHPDARGRQFRLFARAGMSMALFFGKNLDIIAPGSPPESIRLEGGGTSGIVDSGDVDVTLAGSPRLRFLCFNSAWLRVQEP